MKHTFIPFKLLVVDNGSSQPDNAIMIENFLKKLGDYQKVVNKRTNLAKYNLLISEYNDGYAKGNNKGLVYIEADDDIDFVLILNNDILFTQDILPSMISVIKGDSQIGVVCPLLKRKDNISIDYNCARKCISVKKLGLIYMLAYRNVFGIVDRIKQSSLIFCTNPKLLGNMKVEIDLPSGSCMLFRKEVLLEINNFDPNTFLYFEENILFKKLKKLGLKNYILPQISCIHLGASTTAKNKGSFVHLCGIQSAKYYVDNYSNASVYEKTIFYFGYQIMRIKIQMLKAIGK